MQNDPQASPSYDANSAAPLDSPPVQGGKPIAPVWHTALVVAILLVFSFLGSNPKGVVMQGGSRILLYTGTFFFELIVFSLIWIWVRRSGVPMKELIGGRWTSVESFLIDVAIAVGFLIVADVLMAGVRVALGTLDLNHMDKQLAETQRMLGPLIPRTRLELGLFVG